MLEPSVHATARRNLAQRIDRFLRNQVMTDWPADQVLTAIELLDTEQFADGERIMMKAEKAAIFEPAGYVSAARRDAKQLLEKLERVLAE